MLAMMAMPPPETTQRAARSATSRRLGVWRLRFCWRSRESAPFAELPSGFAMSRRLSRYFPDRDFKGPERERTARWRESTTGPSRSGEILLKLGQLFLDNLAGQGDEAVLDHRLLPLLRQDVLQELAHQRIERLVGGLVDVDVEEARQRVLARQHVLRRCRRRTRRPAWPTIGTTRTPEVL